MGYYYGQIYISPMALFHYGVKGMRWGIRRTPEQLGHEPKKRKTVANSENHVTIKDGMIRSSKGFSVAEKKISQYYLKPGTKHSQELFEVGYTPADVERLFLDLEKGYDLSKKIVADSNGHQVERFSIPMELGITNKKVFRTAWQKDSSDSEPRSISIYRDRRLNK